MKLNETWLEKLISARLGVLTLREKYPNENALISAAAQLEYLIALEQGVESDDSALERITLGYLSAYPLSDIISHELWNTLAEIDDKVKPELRRQGRKSELG